MLMRRVNQSFIGGLLALLLAITPFSVHTFIAASSNDGDESVRGEVYEEDVRDDVYEDDEYWYDDEDDWTYDPPFEQNVAGEAYYDYNLDNVDKIKFTKNGDIVLDKARFVRTHNKE